MRRILFGTFHLRGYTHFVELAHMHERPAHLGIVAARLIAHDAGGRLVSDRQLALDQPVLRLTDYVPDDQEELLIGIEVEYNIDRCELIYGYLDLPGSNTSGVYYPINFTKGLRDRASHLNTGSFSFGPLSPIVDPVLFVGNYADFADVSGRLTLHYGPTAFREDVTLGPKRMRFMKLDPERDGHALQRVDLVSTARLATYVMGMGRSGGFMFFEHLMQLVR